MSKILTGLNESTYRKYDNNRTGFSRGPRDDERHDLDVQQPSKQEWALKINGKVWSKDGKTVTFASKEQALKARQSLLAKRPELEVGLVTRGGVSEAGTGLDIDRSIPGRTIARVSDKAGKSSSSASKLSSYSQHDDEYDSWSGKVDPSIHDDEEDTFDTDYTGDEEGELKEISNDALAKYKTAAAADAGKADKEGDYKRGDKRFSGIVKATKKQFANDTKKSAIGQGVNENLGDSLKSNALNALLQVKQQIEQTRNDELSQWEQDFKRNVADKFKNKMPNQVQSTPVAEPGEKFAVLKSRLSELDKAIEKQKVLDRLVQQAESKGLLNPALQADTDTSMYVRGGAKDNYVALNQKLDKALDIIRARLSTNKVAFSKSKSLEEDELDEACWKGYHKEGNKKMFGKTYPNCVKNTNEEEQLDEKCWDTHKQVGMKNKGGKSVPNCVPKESIAEGVAEEQHSCPHCGGEMVSEELMNEKKDACYYKVKSRYKVWPSAYASGALVKCRKKGASNWGTGGKKNESSILEGLEQVDENLHKWFKEKWVRFGPDGKIRGDCARGDDSEGKPKCLPQSKAHSLGKKGRASAASRKRREDPNPERSGKAINVNTKKKSNEGVAEAGDTPKGQKMLAKVHNRAADRVTSKQADKDPAYARKAQQTQDRAWDRLAVKEETLDEKWSQKYKSSINCSNPKGFSQKAHCAGKKK